jgi:ribonucleotide reductase alpha subunit
MDMEVDRDKLAHLELTENAVAALNKRYLEKDEQGETIGEPMEVFRRVAGNIAEGEKSLQIEPGLGLLPNSPTLMRPLPSRRPWRRFAGQSARSALVSLSR